jgi:hypothetical protein
MKALSRMIGQWRGGCIIPKVCPPMPSGLFGKSHGIQRVGQIVFRLCVVSDHQRVTDRITYLLNLSEGFQSAYKVLQTETFTRQTKSPALAANLSNN